MAKYESTLHGDFDTILNTVAEGILNGSVSADFEDGSDYRIGGVHCAVRVFERYSMIGSNRVSLNLTFVDGGEGVFFSAITSGGSQAVLFKINTLGEESFLECAIRLVRQFE